MDRRKEKLAGVFSQPFRIAKSAGVFSQPFKYSGNNSLKEDSNIAVSHNDIADPFKESLTYYGIVLPWVDNYPWARFLLHQI
jgi:hypothetical protein